MKRLGEVIAEYALPAGAAESLARLVSVLAAEPDPPTTVTDPESAFERHVLDSLSGLAVPQLREAARIADIGSGAGFPGLPLALALPSARVDLVESAARKARLIARLIDATGATNARAVTSRVEELAAGDDREAYDVATARAVASLPVVLEYAAPLLRPGGTVVVWRGARDPGEEEAARRAAPLLGLSEGDVVPVTPFAEAHSRHLHAYTKIAPTPARFPRRPGVARKRPLG